MEKIFLTSVAIIGSLLATAGGAKAQPAKPVVPGTIVVHLNGQLQFEFADAGSTGNNVSTSSGIYKLSPVTTNGDLRLYTGFDAQTLTGIDYGVQVELRTASSDAGAGAQHKTGTAGTSGVEALYLKRAYGYLGTPATGFVRLGQTDSAFTLLQTGVVEAFGDGSQFASTDGTVASIVPSSSGVAGSNNFIYADTSNLYATDKIVYISPTFDGLSGGVGYEPNSNGFQEGYANNTSASSTSAALAASPTPSDIGARRKNTVDAAVQYKFENNGILYKISSGILYGAPISYDGAVPTSASPLKHGYDNLEVYQVGGQATFAGLTLGVNLKGGQVLNGYDFKPKGARDALAYIITANYVIGPYVIGANFFTSQSAGSFYPGHTLAIGTERYSVGHSLGEYGIAVGGNYLIGKDMNIFLEYEYDHLHQFANSSLNVNDPLKGDAQAQVIALGTTIRW